MSAQPAPLTTLAGKIAKEGLTPKNISTVAGEIAKTFNVREHEVGILIRDKQVMRFVYPAKLATAGTIPLSASTVAVAARVVNSKSPEIINNLAQTKHASVFEAIGIDARTPIGHHLTAEEKAAHVIQKMMTVPIVAPTGVIGVVEVSRKGRSAPEAGADFTPADLQKLTAIVASFAKNLK